MGLQSKSINQINDAMRNIILACTNNVVDTRKLCAADAEYAFLQIRSKSVGEEVKPQVVCTTCSKETVIKIKLDEITITPTTKPVVDSNIKITDTLAIVMRYPSIHDIDYNKTEVEIAFDLAKRCIESVIVDEQVYQVKDINPQELTDFVDNMMPEQFAKIMNFIQSVPELSYEFQYQCPQCSETVKVQLKSVSDFFR